MTKEKAVKKLKSLCHNCSKFPQCVITDRECFEALEMAIKALEQEPSAENEEIVESMIPLITELVPEITTVLKIVSGKLADIPNEEWMEFVAKKSGKNNFEQPTDGDLISREEIIIKAKKEAKGMEEPFRSNFVALVEWLVEKLPSAEKTAEWIKIGEGIKVTEYKCSACGRIVRDDTDYDVVIDYPYCHCGCRMKEVE